MSNRYRAEPWYNMWCIKDADNPTWVSPLNLPDDVDKATARDIAELAVARLEGRDVLGELRTATDERERAIESASEWKRDAGALRAELERLTVGVEKTVATLRMGAAEYSHDLSAATVAEGAADSLCALLTPEVPRG